MAVDLLVGTTKGLFILTDTGGRGGWRLTGPFCEGLPVNHAASDPAKGTVWAAGGGGWWEPTVWCRRDGDWQKCGAFGEGVQAIWSLALAQDGTLYAGTKPASLWASHDGGDNWQKLPALNDQPGADDWMPGAAGLTLHTIMCGGHGEITVGISAAGAFHSPDGGATWEKRVRRSNRRGPAGDLAADPGNPYAPDAGTIFTCVHNMVQGAAPGLVYMQNHQGVYRSRDGGQMWDEITAGLPSTFGFPVAAHPRDPGTLWVFPLNGDDIGRYPVDGRALVWRSRDGGESWQSLGQGLPARDCFFTVLRQAMATDRETPAGVYFGTNSGSVFASRDEGDHWDEVARHLPTVLCVETMARG